MGCCCVRCPLIVLVAAGVGVAGAGWLGGSWRGGQEAAGDGEGRAAVLTVAQPEDGQPDMDEAMKEMAAMFAAGPEHKVLEPLVGTFSAVMHMQMAPDAPAMESTASSKNEWVMDGKFMRQEFKGDFMGTPFTGLGFVGYDRPGKRYQQFWMDSVSTTMYLSAGAASEDGKTLTYTGKETDPMTGETLDYKDVITITDNDHHTFKRSYITPDGAESAGFEIRYTRAGGAAPKAGS